MYMYSTEHEQWKLKLNVQILYLSYLPFCCSCYILAASAGTGAPRTPFPAAPAGFPFLHGSWPQPTQEASCSCHLHLAHHRSRRLAQVVVVVYLALPLARARSATPPLAPAGCSCHRRVTDRAEPRTVVGRGRHVNCDRASAGE